jgi:hypothetical protein
VDERTGRNVEPNLRARIRAGDPDAFGLIFDEHALRGVQPRLPADRELGRVPPG